MAGGAMRARTGPDRTLGPGDLPPRAGICIAVLKSVPSSEVQAAWPRQIGSVARQPSHQIRAAATAINMHVTIRLRPAVSWRKSRVMSRCCASLSALFERMFQNVEIDEAPWRAVPVSLPNQAIRMRRRRIMLRQRCETIPKSLRRPVPSETRGSGGLKQFAINRQVGGNECGLIHGPDDIQPGWPGHCSRRLLAFLKKHGARG